MRGTRYLGAALCVPLLLAATACGDDDDEAADTTTTTVAEGPTEIEVTLTADGFDGMPSELPAGLVEITLVNESGGYASLDITRVTDGTTEDEFLEGLEPLFEGGPFPDFFESNAGVDAEDGETETSLVVLREGEHIVWFETPSGEDEEEGPEDEGTTETETETVTETEAADTSTTVPGDDDTTPTTTAEDTTTTSTTVAGDDEQGAAAGQPEGTLTAVAAEDETDTETETDTQTETETETETETLETPDPSALPGERIDIFPYEGDELAVVGVEADDVLNVRAAPGVRYEVVAELDPLDDGIEPTGHNRQIDDGAIWAEITVDGTTGWASTAFLAHAGDVRDVTSELYPQVSDRPAAITVDELGALVADRRAGDGEPEPRIVVVDGPTVGDLGEITVDVLGYPDDAQLGERLRVFAEPDPSGDGFDLRTVESTTLCRRGVSDGLCV